MSQKPDSQQLQKFILTLVVPLLITKSIAFYFGLKMAEFPDEGYGWGLAISLGFTVFTFVRFIVKNKNAFKE